MKVQSGSLYGSALCPLYIRCGCLAWFSCEISNIGSGTVSVSFAWSWDSFPPTGLPHPSLMCLCLVFLYFVVPCSVDVPRSLPFSGRSQRRSRSGG